MATIKYLSRAEVAALLGIQVHSMNRMELPEPDAVIGSRKGYLRATILAWNAKRPGRGNWKHTSGLRKTG